MWWRHSSFLLAGALALQEISAARLYMAGDSTMALGGGGAGTQGWGVYLSNYLNIPIDDDATAGRSARSYTTEGRFANITSHLQKGDYVIIEFGHNDGGSLTPVDNGRSDCFGSGSQTCQTFYNGVNETVLTYPAYLENAVAAMKAKGATVIISSLTPDNPWESGNFTYVPSRFVSLAELAATVVMTAYVDHGSYVAAAYQKLGKSVVNTYYPNDHTHTSPAGAVVVTQAFVRGLSCGSSPLKRYIKRDVAIAGNCLDG